MAECVESSTASPSTASPLKEPFVGNVSKFSPHSVAASGSKDRRKKGHLVFDACFESGTLVAKDIKYGSPALH